MEYRFFKTLTIQVSLLMWLESAQNLQNAVGMLLDHIKKESRPQVEKLVRQSVEDYARPQSDLVMFLCRYFLLLAQFCQWI